MTPQVEAFMLQSVELLRRCGMTEWQIRYQDDQEPTVWISLARFAGGWNAGCGLGPQAAIVDLLEKSIDGGECLRCGRVMSLTPPGDLTLPIPQLCQVVYLSGQGWRRSCEGESN